MKYYLDTCIWFDYFENREDNLRPLGEWALKLINKIISEEGIFIFDEHLLNELRNKYSREILNRYFEIIPLTLIINVKINEYQIREATKFKQMLKIPFEDALHAIVARDNHATLISRDKQFQEIDFIECYKPEDLV